MNCALVIVRLTPLGCASKTTGEQHPGSRKHAGHQFFFKTGKSFNFAHSGLLEPEPTLDVDLSVF
jgi:hypothetical protein